MVTTTRGTTLHIYVNLWVATSVHAEQTQGSSRLNYSKSLTNCAKGPDMSYRHQNSLKPKSDLKAPSSTSRPPRALRDPCCFYGFPVAVWGAIKYAAYGDLSGTVYKVSTCFIKF